MTLLRISRIDRDKAQCIREIAEAERKIRAGEPREDLLPRWWLDQKAELAILAEQMGLEVGDGVGDFAVEAETNQA